ncbi:hypothetical protein [Neisseria perflava]|uniref:hypothetical protein n=1 Tax=Neisseria perflava TaxID=33053 RepID=UPI0020A0DA63|nr:hypothetical protein [Neisseria perflava]MCP1659368.1 hypothetical protein [Neisseria perflava]
MKSKYYGVAVIAGMAMLGACSSVDRVHKSETETIQAAMISGNTLYLAGEKYDYQFDGADIGKFAGFIRSPLARLKTRTSMEIRVNEKQAAQIGYRVAFQEKLTPHQEEQLTQTYGQKYRVIHFNAQGRVVTLANKAEMLQKHRWRKAEQVRLSHTKRGYLLNDGLKTVIGAPVILGAAVVVVPLATAMTVGCLASDGCPFK